MRTDILERKPEILQWIDEQQPKCWIAQQLGCKQETLNSYLNKMGIEYKGQQAKKGQVILCVWDQCYFHIFGLNQVSATTLHTEERG